jgi:hypothetical protein
MDRKYRQRGYSDRDTQDKKRERTERPPKPHSGEPRPKMLQDPNGPRAPRMVGSVTRARCASCGALLSPGFDANGDCPRCHAALHSCKQCVNFDTARQFECTQPVQVRYTPKDAKNDCTFFQYRMTVEKDTAPIAAAVGAPQASMLSPGRPNDARKAFEDLFKK